MDKTDKICMISLGCAKNLVDSEILIGGLRQEKEKFSIAKDISNIGHIILKGFPLGILQTKWGYCHQNLD